MSKSHDVIRGTLPTAAQAEGARPRPAAAQAPAWTRSQLLAFYEKMVTSRYIDDEEYRLCRRGDSYFSVGSAGHEAIGLAAGCWLRPGHDWFYCHYRDRALMLSLGMTPYEMFLGAVAAKDDPNSSGRQMPCHWGLRRANVVSRSSSIGTQFHQSAGSSFAGRYILSRELDLPAKSDEILFCSTGEGTTCEGEFFEAVNFACIHKLRMLILVEDNDYAISVPVEESIAGGSLSKVLRGFPGLEIFEVDGTDLLASLSVMKRAVDGLRSGEFSPALIHAHVTRPYSHALSDDHTTYRTAAELEEENSRDCIQLFRKYLLEDKMASEEELAAIEERAREAVAESSRQALAAPKPAPSDACAELYSGFAPVSHEKPPASVGEPVTLSRAINLTLAEEMSRDPRIVLFGEDVADAGRAEAFVECKGKGGVFKVSAGLQAKFGRDRVFNAPLAEAGIIGRAIGMAIRGLKPVAEIQFFDFIWPAMTQIRNELATMRYRSGGRYSAPVVVRVPIGGYLRGGAMYHSQSAESIFARCSGLYVVYPSDASDACGLLRTALRGEDPVLFLEPKTLYFQSIARRHKPSPEYMIPFGKAAVKRAGTDVTVISWGTLVHRCLEAAERLAAEENLSVEVIDLRTLVPLDLATIIESVQKTGRCLVAAEEAAFAGFSAEISAQIVENCFSWLDAPIRRIGALHSWVPYSPVLEETVLPKPETILSEIRSVAKY